MESLIDTYDMIEEFVFEMDYMGCDFDNVRIDAFKMIHDAIAKLSYTAGNTSMSDYVDEILTNGMSSEERAENLIIHDFATGGTVKHEPKTETYTVVNEKSYTESKNKFRNGKLIFAIIRFRQFIKYGKEEIPEEEVLEEYQQNKDLYETVIDVAGTMYTKKNGKTVLSSYTPFCAAQCDLLEGQAEKEKIAEFNRQLRRNSSKDDKYKPAVILGNDYIDMEGKRRDIDVRIALYRGYADAFFDFMRGSCQRTTYIPIVRGR